MDVTEDRPVEPYTLHFDLSHLTNKTDLSIQVGLASHPILSHDQSSRTIARQRLAFLNVVPDDHLTHYSAELALPTDAIVLISVTRSLVIDGQTVEQPVAMSVHIPSEGHRQARLAEPDLPWTVEPKLARFVEGTHEAMLQKAGDLRAPEGIDEFKTVQDTAAYLLSLHPSLANFNATDGGSIPALIHSQCIKKALSFSGTLAFMIEISGDHWVTTVPALGPDDQPLISTVTGQPLYSHKLNPTVAGALPGPLQAAIGYSRDLMALKNHLWTVQPGRTTSPYNGHAVTKDAAALPREMPRMAAPGATGTAKWVLNNLSPGSGVKINDALDYVPPTNDGTPAGQYGTLTLQVDNSWLRYLGAYVQFVGLESNDVITPISWDDQLPSILADMFERNPTKKFLDIISPVQTLFGIPLPVEPATIVIPVPAGTNEVYLLLGGLGRGPYDADVCAIGITLTVVFDLALPLVLLIAGTAITNSTPFSKAIQSLLANKPALARLCVSMGSLAGGVTAVDMATSQNPLVALRNIAVRVGPMLLTSGGSALAKLLITSFAAGVAEKAIPFVDMASVVFNSVVTAAQLAETTIEVLDSPFVFESRITMIIDIQTTLQPDSRFHRFPDQATTYEVTVIYSQSATQAVKSFDLPGAPPWSDPITVKFTNTPSGVGLNLKIQVRFYSANGWPAGQGESDWYPALGNNGSLLLIPPIEITTNTVPLTAGSVYRHESKIAYDLAQGGHYWQAAPGQPPIATAMTQPVSPDHAINKLVSITMAQGPAQMGYVWEATGLDLPVNQPTAPTSSGSLYTAQNLSTLQEPERQFAMPAVGFTLEPGLVYNLTGSNDPAGLNFFVDSSKGAYDETTNIEGGMHLRQLAIQYDGAPPQFSLDSPSFGRFPTPLTRYALHPQGYFVGIQFDNHANKIYLLKIPATGSADADAPHAHLASGEGYREGLMRGPIALTIAMDGRILVLESLNQRVQAFDIHGNPVPCFADPKNPGTLAATMAIQDSESSHYLDFAVEPKGFLYLLRYTGDGSQPSDYRVDIYNPDGSFLVTTPDVAAARIVVSELRNLYTLNYETISGPGGRTEPSVSLWIPPAPSS